MPTVLPKPLEQRFGEFASKAGVFVCQRAKRYVGEGMHAHIGAALDVAAQIRPRPISVTLAIDDLVADDLHCATAKVTDAGRGEWIKHAGGSTF